MCVPCVCECVQMKIILIYSDRVMNSGYRGYRPREREEEEEVDRWILTTAGY